MAAWYLLSAMGFYPLCPGKPEYVLGSPLFDRVTLHLNHGRTTTIEAEALRQLSKAIYVSSLMWAERLRTHLARFHPLCLTLH
jgi:putative alpha-1,2-mannosidase